jgi:hypothetical protein
VLQEGLGDRLGTQARASRPRVEPRLAVSVAVAAHLLPRQQLQKATGPAEVTRQAGDQGICGVEVRGFEPLASSVRERIGG